MSSNIPISVTKGAHGTRYYSIQQSFDFLAMGLSPDEVLAAMLLAQFSGLFKGTKIGNDIQNVFKKIDQLMPTDAVAVSSTLNGLTDVFRIHQHGKVDVETGSNVLGKIFSAIIRKQEVEIEYHRSAEATKSKFQFHPYSLLLHSNSIYCLGFQPRHKGWIYLALQRIRNVKLQDKNFERDPEFNLEDFLKDNFGIWHEDPVDVVIRFDSAVSNSIQERTWHHSQRIEPIENGGLELSMHVGPSEELIAWILRWGIHAEVLHPESIRQRIKEVYFKGLEIYNSSDTK